MAYSALHGFFLSSLSCLELVTLVLFQFFKPRSSAAAYSLQFPFSVPEMPFPQHTVNSYSFLRSQYPLVGMYSPGSLGYFSYSFAVQTFYHYTHIICCRLGSTNYGPYAKSLCHLFLEIKLLQKKVIPVGIVYDCFPDNGRIE